MDAAEQGPEASLCGNAKFMPSTFKELMMIMQSEGSRTPYSHPHNLTISETQQNF